MKKQKVFGFIFLLMTFCLFAERKTVVDILVKTENIADSEGIWLSPAVAEKIEANLSKYTDFTFVNSTNRKDIFELQKQSESDAFEDAIEIGKLKNADYVLFTTLRKVGGQYTISVRLTDITTGENKVSAILSSPQKDVQNLYSSNGCAVDEITVEFCKALGNPLSNTQISFLMNGDVTLSKEERQSLYDEDVKLFNKQIEQLNKELKLVSSSTDLEDISKQEKLKAEKILAEERLKLAEENKKRIEEEIKQRKADEKKNAERSAEQQKRLISMAEELNEKVESVRNKNFENESVVGQIQVIELKKKAVIDIHNSIISEIEKTCHSTVEKILDKQEEIANIPYRAGEVLEDGKTPSDFAIEQRRNIYNKEKEKLINEGESDINLLTEKLISHKKTLLAEIKKDYSKLGYRKISTLGNELVVTYGAYDGDKKGWELYVTVKSDGFILFKTTSFLSFKALTGKDPVKYAKDDYFAYLNDVDFYDSLFLRGEPILVFELKYKVKPEDINKPSQYHFQFSDFMCYDTQTLKVKKDKLKSSKTNKLSLNHIGVIREMTTIYDLQPAFKYLPTFEKLVEMGLERHRFDTLGLMREIRKLPAGTNGSLGPRGVYVEFGNWPQSIKKGYVTIDTSNTITINGWTCYKGSDNCYYIKSKANPYHDDDYEIDEFSNGEEIVRGKDYYFKMEPIKWRVVTDDYNGGKLLVAENVLVGKRFHSNSNNYYSSEIIEWLNNDFKNGAFTKENIENINTNKQNKIFLLSVDEATKDSYGFGSDNARIRKITDYSEATGAFSINLRNGSSNGQWWLRSPLQDSSSYACSIFSDGSMGNKYVSLTHGGIVPALSISF